MPPKTKDNRVTNALTGKKVSPDIDWLIDRLAELIPLKNRPGDYNAYVIDRHAHQIYGHWLTWRWRGDRYVTKIRGKQRPYAEHNPVKVSIEKELERLLTAAQGRSDKVWINAWLGVTSRTRGLIGWRPHDGSGGFEISPRGLHAVAPFRADALPLIKAALRKHEAMSASDRQKRQGDSLADDVARAVSRAYRHLTGKRGLIWDNALNEYRGGLLDLARDIEAHFKCARLLSVDRLKK
jgi:hypothetical protein